MKEKPDTSKIFICFSQPRVTRKQWENLDCFDSKRILFIANIKGHPSKLKIVTKIVKHLRNSLETPSTQNLRILRNFQHWLKLLVSYLDLF